MVTFEINGKEYELKLTFKSIKYLNKIYGADEGGALALVLHAVQGDIELFPHVIYAGLMHTGENFSYKTIEKAIEQAFEDEKIDLDYVIKTSNKVVTNSFFYRATAKKLLGDNEETERALKQLTE